jgi:signal transduction histidine kinase
MKIETRVKISWALTLCVLLAYGALVVYLDRTVGSLAQEVEEANEIVDKISILRTLTQDYLLYRTERSQRQWSWVYGEVGQLIEHRESQVLGSEDGVGDASYKLKVVGETFARLRAIRGKPGQTEQEAKTTAELQNRLSTQLLLVTRNLVARFINLSKEINKKLIASQRFSSSLNVVALLTLGGLLLSNAVFLQRSVVKPVLKLHEGAEIIGAGNLDHKAGITSTDEIGQLSRAFDAMTANIKTLTVSRNELAREVHERKFVEGKLKKTLENLGRSNKELEEFAYVASHDLQEPLRKMANFSEMLANRYQGQLDERADKYLGYITDGAVRMKKLINDLLSFSRVGRADFSLIATDLNDVLQGTLNDIQPLVRENQAEINYEPLPTLKVNPYQMGQLLQNLITNAIKFHGDQPPRIHLSARQEGREWVMAVRDNGIGFDPQYADRIFKVFQRLHTKEEYPGTGIGLAICKKIAERHGGRIWAESAPGQGATFYFSVPT